MENGTAEKDRNETHHYNYKKGIDRQISWEEDTITHKIQQTKAFLVKYKDNVIDQSISKLELKSSIDAATFVIGLPFTLNSSEISLTYEGLSDFQKTSCHTLKAMFSNSKDIWSLFYEEETLAWKGYWVQTPDHNNLVINDKMTEVNGFMLPQKRTSYRTDSIKNITYKRADYLYEDYLIETN